MLENSKQTNNRDVIFALSEALSGLVIREHQILQGELNQIGGLVESAVKVLGNNLRELNENVTAQNLIVDHDDGNVSSDVGEFSRISNQVNKNASNMVRALQFDDIVQQLAGHASDRIGQMQELFHLLDTQVSELKKLDVDNVSNSNHHMQTMIDNIDTFRQLLEKKNPVKQDTMAEGRIELF